MAQLAELFLAEFLFGMVSSRILSIFAWAFSRAVFSIR